MECFQHDDECTVWAIGEREDIIPDDVFVKVFKNGIECGEIWYRFDDENNELSWGFTRGLPAWIVGLYHGEDYPNSATAEGYTFA
jgi:hypothetical protein